MIAAVESLWKQIPGSPWILIILPTLLVFRWLLKSRSRRLEAARRRFFSLPFWDSALSAPHSGGETARAEPVDAVEYRRRWLFEVVESGFIALSLVLFVIRPFLVQAFYIPSQSMEETLQINDRILVNKLVFRLRAPRRGDIVVFEPPIGVSPNRNEDWIKRVIGLPGDRIAVRDNHLYLNGCLQKEPYAALLDPSPESDGVGRRHVHTGVYNYIFPDPDTISGLRRLNLRDGREAAVYEEPGSMVQDQRYVARPVGAHGVTDSLFLLDEDSHEDLEAVVPPGKVFVMGDNRNNSEDSHYWGCLSEKRILGRAFCIFWPLKRASVLREGV